MGRARNRKLLTGELVPSSPPEEKAKGKSAEPDKGKGVLISDASEDSESNSPKTSKDGASGSHQYSNRQHQSTVRLVQPRDYWSAAIPLGQRGHNADNKRPPICPWPDLEEEEMEAESSRMAEPTAEPPTSIRGSGNNREPQTEPFFFSSNFR